MNDTGMKFNPLLESLRELGEKERRLLLLAISKIDKKTMNNTVELSEDEIIGAFDMSSCEFAEYLRKLDK